MSRLEDLPPDLRAVLSLLLRQRKGYHDVAALLRIQERAVRDRAHAALAMLAPRQARELTIGQRTLVGDYMLGQLSASERAQASAELAASGAARDWAQAISAELAPLGVSPLPAIPLGEHPPTPISRLPSSRLGGAILLGAIAVVVIVTVLLITGSGSGGGSKTASNAATSGSTSATTTSTGSTGATSTGATSTSAATPKQEGSSTLTSPDPASNARGTILVLSQSGKRAFYLQITGLAAAPSGSLYAVWLTGTAVKAEAVGVLPAPNASGQIEGGALLPTNVTKYHRVLVTRETNQRPSHPGPTVLAGPLTLH